MPVDKQQFPLHFTVDKCPPKEASAARRARSERSSSERIDRIDQVLSTRDVQGITGRHRCTIYRWVRAGTFTENRTGGGRGWLRSDVERWLNGGGPANES
jgi:predicted DNA-binding transcriptional regulator AlpA